MKKISLKYVQRDVERTFLTIFRGMPKVGDFGNNSEPILQIQRDVDGAVGRKWIEFETLNIIN